MHLISRPNNKVRYLYLIESAYCSERRTTIKKVVKNLGRFDALPKAVAAIYNDPEQRQLLAAKAEELYRRQQLQAPDPETPAAPRTRADKAKERQDFLTAVLHAYEAEIQKKAAEKSKPQDSRFNRALLLRYGHLLVKNIWQDELGLTYKIDYLQKNKTDISTWRLNDLLFYICALNLIDPQSFRSAYAQKSNFLYCPWNGMTQDNFHRALNFVCDHREELIKHAVRQHQKKSNTKVELAFIYCTNPCPEMTAALAIDQTGFPIDCKVFPGGRSEMDAIEPVITSLKEKYNASSVCFVAGGGRDFTAPLDALQKHRQGFVFAQEVSRLEPEMRSEMLSLEGYRNYRIDAAGEVIALDVSLGKESARFKACEFVKEIRIEDSNAGLTKEGSKKSHPVLVKGQIIFIFDPEHKMEDAIAEHKETAGYSAIVYLPPCSEGDEESPEKLQPTQVLSTCRKLVNMKERFQVMSRNFSICPGYMPLRSEMTAHCSLCVISLMMLRSLQEKLSSIGVQMSLRRIFTALKNALLLPLPSEEGIQGFFNAGMAEIFHTPDKKGAPEKMHGGENEAADNNAGCSKLEKERTSAAGDVDLIMQAAGLSPLKYFSTMGQIKKHFGLHNLPDASIVSFDHVEYNKRLAASAAQK